MRLVTLLLVCITFYGTSSLRLASKQKRQAAETSSVATPDTLPGCLIASKSAAAAKAAAATCNDAQTCPATPQQPRVVVVGDIHGEGAGLREVLDGANITKAGVDACEWAPQPAAGTVLVQVGDIVDRGAEAYEAWVCLRQLHATASGANKVVQLLGNHDVWWLEGKFHMINREADTKEKIIAVVDSMKEGVLDGSIVGSYVHRIQDQPVLFVHAGFRPTFLTHLRQTLSDASPEGLAAHVNGLLKGVVSRCMDDTMEFVPCTFDDDVFEAGPDRGGKSLGGPFWTDFHVIEEAAAAAAAPPEFVQVTGHTMAWCYDPSEPGVYPGDEVAECGMGLVRATRHLSAVCVDGGMYAGGRAFLEIGHDGKFRAFQRTTGPGTAWQMKDLTSDHC